MNDDVIDVAHTSLAVMEPEAPLATPAVGPEEAKAAMAQYFELCEAVLQPSDYQEFTQKKKVDGRWVSEVKKFKKKSAVKKLQTFFGVNVELKTVDRDELPDGHYGYRVVATARARNGRVVEATGACSTMEERFDLTPYDDESEARFAIRLRKALARAYHDVISTAETRATNRAVMNCIGVGGGEVTADEVSRDSAPRRAPQAAPRVSNRPPEPIPEPEDVHRKAIVAIMALCRTKGIIDAQRYALTNKLFGVASTADLDIQQLRALYKELSAFAEGYQ